MWKTLSSKIVHKNNWFRIRRNKFKTPKNKIGYYYMVDMPGAVSVIPVQGNNIIFEKQYRYIFNKWFLELPCGTVEKYSNPLRTAKNELKEETGYRARSLKKVGLFHPTHGTANEKCEVFLATDLEFIGQKLEETEDIKIVKIPIKKAYAIIEKGKIIDGFTISALAIARNLLLKK